MTRSWQLKRLVAQWKSSGQSPWWLVPILLTVGISMMLFLNRSGMRSKVLKCLWDSIRQGYHHCATTFRNGLLATQQVVRSHIRSEIPSRACSPMPVWQWEGFLTDIQSLRSLSLKAHVDGFLGGLSALMTSGKSLVPAATYDSLRNQAITFFVSVILRRILTKKGLRHLLIKLATTGSLSQRIIHTMIVFFRMQPSLSSILREWPTIPNVRSFGTIVQLCTIFQT